MNDDLLARARRALSDRPVADVVPKVRAIIGAPILPAGEDAAQRALDKLKANERPTPAELAALELVIRLLRPAPLSAKGELAALPRRQGRSVYDEGLTTRWDRFREQARGLVLSVGRLDRLEGGRRVPTGTGFLVADDLLLTNRHVLDQLSYGAQALEEGQAVVTFHSEDGRSDPEPPVPIVGVEAVHATLDMALLRVRLSAQRTVAVLAGEPAPGTEIAAIGYPWKDPTSPLFADAVFGNKYGVKRAALGEVMAVGGDRFFHDCSTLGGNSGSPIVSIESAEVVGLHFGGLFMYRNEAIPAPSVSAFVAS